MGFGGGDGRGPSGRGGRAEPASRARPVRLRAGAATLSRSLAPVRPSTENHEQMLRNVVRRARVVVAGARPSSAPLVLVRPAARPVGSPRRSFSSSRAVLAASARARGAYKTLTASDISAFLSFLSSPSSLVTTIASPDGTWTCATSEDLYAVNHDWMQKYSGHSQVLLKPKSTQEVSRILAYCYSERIAVVPQGGNTGLVGGSTPVYDEVILSTEGMNQVRHFDDVSGPSPPSLFPVAQKT